jgi:hypothetical protein
MEKKLQPFQNFCVLHANFQNFLVFQNLVVRWSFGGQVVIWWSGGHLVVRWSFCGQVVIWWSGGHLVVRWSFGGQVVIWWSGGHLVARWSFGGQVVIWWSGGHLVVRWSFGGQVVIWWPGGHLVVRWSFGGQVVIWWSGGHLVDPLLTQGKSTLQAVLGSYNVGSTLFEAASTESQNSHDFPGLHKYKSFCTSEILVPKVRFRRHK